jgi:hypothetical protein
VSVRSSATGVRRGAQQAATDLADKIAPITLNMDPAAASNAIDEMSQRDAQYQAIVQALMAQAAKRGGAYGAGAYRGRRYRFALEKRPDRPDVNQQRQQDGELRKVDHPDDPAVMLGSSARFPKAGTRRRVVPA